MSQYDGLFLTFEGGEGSGKSSIVKKLSQYLVDIKVEFLATKEPGGGNDFVSQQLRELILEENSYILLPRSEVLLFAADRAQHVENTIVPALKQNRVVLCDRYIDSSIVYQGLVRGMGADWVREISEWATGNLYPDLTFLLDLEPEIGLGRRKDAGGTNRIDKESLEFHSGVREAFLELAKNNPSRFVVVDANRKKETIFNEILGICIEKFPLFFNE